MNNQRLVVVFGESVLMESVISNLKNRLALSVIRLASTELNISEWIKSLKPDLFIFELDKPRPCAILSTLTDQPGMIFLGIDTKYSQVITFNSSRYSIETMQELCKLAERKLNYEEQTEKGGSETDMVESVHLPKMD